MAFMGLDTETDKPRMKAELGIMIAELQLKSNRTKLKTISRDIFISANRDKTSHVNENCNHPSQPRHSYKHPESSFSGTLLSLYVISSSQFH